MPRMNGHGSNDFASKGVAGAGLGLGIAGTALGVLAAGEDGLLGGLGGGRDRRRHGDHDICGNNLHYFESKEAAALREENAKLSATLCAERGDFKLAENFNREINELQRQIGCMEKQIAVNKLECQNGDERLWCKMPETTRVIPGREVCFREGGPCHPRRRREHGDSGDEG